MYSISDLELLSGIHAHTIRIWERRYHALTPHRTVGNTRYYDDSQLLRLLNIVSINQKGLKIAKACALSDDSIKAIIDQQINETVASSQKIEFYISQLLSFGLAYNEASFNVLINKCIKKYGLKHCYLHIIYPLLVRLGLMWRKESVCPAQEHFLTHLIRQKIVVSTDNLPIVKATTTWLLFLPEDESHEIGLLFANYLLRQANIKVIYLGALVPLTSIAQAMIKNDVDHLLFFMQQQKNTATAQNYINILAENYTNKHIYLAGGEELIGKLQFPSNIKAVKTVDDFENIIKKLNE